MGLAPGRIELCLLSRRRKSCDSHCGSGFNARTYWRNSSPDNIFSSQHENIIHPGGFLCRKSRVAIKKLREQPTCRRSCNSIITTPTRFNHAGEPANSAFSPPSMSTFRMSMESRLNSDMISSTVTARTVPRFGMSVCPSARPAASNPHESQSRVQQIHPPGHRPYRCIDRRYISERRCICFSKLKFAVSGSIAMYFRPRKLERKKRRGIAHIRARIDDDFRFLRQRDVILAV